MDGKQFYKVLFLFLHPWSATDIINGKKVNRGAIFNILDDLSQGLNFSYEAMLPKTRGWGTKLPNGTWTGFMGMIQSGEADFAIIPSACTADRYEDFHITPTFYTSYTTILSGGSQVTPKNLFGYFMTFSMEVWIGILLSLLLMSALSTFCDAVLERFENKKISISDTFSSNFWNYLPGLFNEATEKSPKWGLNKFLLGLWLLVMLILLNAFTGQFKSSLMLVKEPEKINSIEDLANREDVNVLLWKGGVFETLLRTSKQEAVRKVAARVFTSKSNNLVSVEEMYGKENIRRVQQGKVSFISDASVIKSQLAKQCSSPDIVGSMYMAREPIQPLHLILILNKDLPNDFKSRLDRRIQSLVEGDFINKWLNEMFGDWRRCENIQSDDEKSMGFEDFQAVFVLWALCMCTAVGAFIGEILIGKTVHKRTFNSDYSIFTSRFQFNA